MEAFNARPISERDKILGGLPGFRQMVVGGGEADRLDSDVPAIRARRAFACPVVVGTVRGIDAEALSPADPDERSLLIEAEHADMFEALRGRREVDINGTKVNPKLHVSMHEIVVNQLWDGDPPETWAAARPGVRPSRRAAHARRGGFTGRVSGAPRRPICDRRGPQRGDARWDGSPGPPGGRRQQDDP
jgi:hypothetical protein